MYLYFIVIEYTVMNRERWILDEIQKMEMGYAHPLTSWHATAYYQRADVKFTWLVVKIFVYLLDFQFRLHIIKAMNITGINAEVHNHVEKWMEDVRITMKNWIMWWTEDITDHSDVGVTAFMQKYSPNINISSDFKKWTFR